MAKNTLIAPVLKWSFCNAKLRSSTNCTSLSAGRPDDDDAAPKPSPVSTERERIAQQGVHTSFKSCGDSHCVNHVQIYFIHTFIRNLQRQWVQWISWDPVLGIHTHIRFNSQRLSRCFRDPPRTKRSFRQNMMYALQNSMCTYWILSASRGLRQIKGGTWPPPKPWRTLAPRSIPLTRLSFIYMSFARFRCTWISCHLFPGWAITSTSCAVMMMCTRRSWWRWTSTSLHPSKFVASCHHLLPTLRLLKFIQCHQCCKQLLLPTSSSDSNFGIHIINIE